MEKNNKIRQRWCINIYGMDSSLLEIIKRIALENQKTVFSDSLKKMTSFLKSDKMKHINVIHDFDNDCLIVQNNGKLVCSVGINSYTPLILQNYKL